MFEKLLNELELWLNIENSDGTNETHKAGLTFYYSVTLRKWIVGYGQLSSKKVKNRPHFYGIGTTIEEALQDKINKENS